MIDFIGKFQKLVLNLTPPRIIVSKGHKIGPKDHKIAQKSPKKCKRGPKFGEIENKKKGFTFKTQVDCIHKYVPKRF